ncbi:hypothetical protein LOZ65_006850 [Ophidiomyces ophidiicola]|nr:hypothetical protein LOZ65_006850 [Ophidiomyces ophidiicola]
MKVLSTIYVWMWIGMVVAEQRCTCPTIPSISPLSTSTLPTQSQPPQSQGSQVCNGLARRKYLTRDTVGSIIENQFCPDAAKFEMHGDGALNWIYNDNTPEAVLISLGWKNLSQTHLPQVGACVHYLRDRIVDGCDGNDPTNPMNWKGGRYLKVNQYEYTVDPTANRQPVPKQPQALCKITAQANYTSVRMWGGGWASSDFGKALIVNLNSCGLLQDTFAFQYGRLEGGYEWAASMLVPPSTKNECILSAATKSGAHQGLSWLGGAEPPAFL